MANVETLEALRHFFELQRFSQRGELALDVGGRAVELVGLQVAARVAVDGEHVDMLAQPVGADLDRGRCALAEAWLGDEQAAGEEGDPEAIDFPRAMMHSGDYDFSLSGLKTAVINHIRHEREAGREIEPRTVDDRPIAVARLNWARVAATDPKRTASESP